MGGTHGKSQRPVVEVGAHVAYRGQTWQVAALQGQQVYLLQEDGTETRLLLGRLFADPGLRSSGRTGAGHGAAVGTVRDRSAGGPATGAGLAAPHPGGRDWLAAP